MKRKISIFISMILLTVTMALGFAVNVNAEEDPSSLGFDKAYAEMIAVNYVANFNSTQYSEELKYLIDDDNVKILYGEEFEKIKSLYEERAVLQEDFGIFHGFTGEAAFEENEDGSIITVILTASYEDGLVAFSVPIDMETFQLTSEADVKIERTKAAGEEKSMGQSMKEAGLNTLMGMGIVFAVLILISFVISLFKLVNRPEKKKEGSASAVKAPEPVVEESEDVTDDCEIVAVITAAIMALMSEAGEEVPEDGLVVRSIRRRKLRA